MPPFNGPDCRFDDTDLEVLKEHMRTAHPERIDISFEIRTDIYLEKHRPRKKDQ